MIIVKSKSGISQNELIRIDGVRIKGISAGDDLPNFTKKYKSEERAKEVMEEIEHRIRVLKVGEMMLQGKTMSESKLESLIEDIIYTMPEK